MTISQKSMEQSLSEFMDKSYPSSMNKKNPKNGGRITRATLHHQIGVNLKPG